MENIQQPFRFAQKKNLISACIVTRNASDALKRYLDSLTKSVRDTAELEMIVVDNDSSDDTKEMLRDHFPQAKHIFRQPGVGFSKGINEAIANSQGEFILIATPSTEITENTISILLNHLLNHQETGVVGPKIINPDGSTQHSSKKMPTPKVAMLHTLYLFGAIRSNKILNEYFLYDYTSNDTLEVTSLTMSLMLARRKVFEDVGVLDENLFAWSSDVDWCFRVEHSQWKQLFIPSAIAIHRRSSVSKKQPFTNLMHYHRDLQFFYQKHYAQKNGWLLDFIWYILLQIRFVMQVARYVFRGGRDYSFY
jgi:GT2 family glycosyltransferase